MFGRPHKANSRDVNQRVKGEDVPGSREREFLLRVTYNNSAARRPTRISWPPLHLHEYREKYGTIPLHEHPIREGNEEGEITLWYKSGSCSQVENHTCSSTSPCRGISLASQPRSLPNKPPNTHREQSRVIFKAIFIFCCLAWMYELIGRSSGRGLTAAQTLIQITTGAVLGTPRSCRPGVPYSLAETQRDSQNNR